MEDLTGKQLGQYQVVEKLGEGGMATVYKAFQPSMERYVALKILPRLLAAEPDFVTRFKNETKVIANLEHPHILPVYDFGEADGYTYLVMRFVEGGQTLNSLLQGKPLLPSQVRRLIGQVASALDYAHSRDVIHRDVKPSNVLLDGHGNCLLSDFGLAKVLISSAQLTASGAFLGTPKYASPEQCMGKSDIDRRSDVYSLGVILYEMVTGRPPFDAETPMGVVIKQIQDPLPLPRTLNPDLPEAVERVVLKALTKEVDGRYSTTDELSQAYDAAVDGGAEDTGSPLVSTAPPTQETQLESQIADYLKKANLALERENWQAAQSNYRKILRLHPDHTEAQIGLRSASRNLELARLYGQAVLLQDEGQLGSALRTLRSIQEKDAAYRDVPELVTAIEELLEKQARVEDPDSLTKKQSDLERPSTLSRVFRYLGGGIVIVLILVLLIWGGGKLFVSQGDNETLTPEATTLVAVAPTIANTPRPVIATDTSGPATSTATFLPTDTQKPSPTYTSTPAPTLTPTQLPKALVNVRNANIRFGPGTNFRVVGSAPEGTELLAIGRNKENTWLVVELDNDKQGWISVDIVDFEFSLDMLPEVESPPTPTSPPPTATPKPPKKPYGGGILLPPPLTNEKPVAAVSYSRQILSFITFSISLLVIWILRKEQIIWRARITWKKSITLLTSILSLG
jgi:serine/threonine protein kinase